MRHTILMMVAAMILPLAACSPPTSSTARTAPTSPTTSSTPDSSKAGAQPATAASDTMNTPNTSSTQKLALTEAQWKAKLTPEQYEVLRQKGTERAFTGKYWNTKDKGVYKCAGCGEVLFTSDSKFDSGCGWPSFNKPADGVVGAGEGQAAKVVEHVDTSYGMRRVEVVCAKCGGHLGHVFEDAPEQPGGLRYCINSASIEMAPESKDAGKDAAKPGDAAKK